MYHSTGIHIFTLNAIVLVLFQVVDFHMNPHDPWTMLSVSDDVSIDSGGGTLQMWRISDMITRPENEVLDEIFQHRYRSMSIVGANIFVLNSHNRVLRMPMVVGLI